MTHRFAVRVYYEDTDLAGIVYYANYLKFIERARTEFIRTLGVDQTALSEEEGRFFAVRKLQAEYLAPARFDDMLQVATSVQFATGARLQLTQDIDRAGLALFSSQVTLICMNKAGRPVRIPRRILGRLTGLGK